MSGTVAALVIGIFLLLTLAVGMATQVFGRARRAPAAAPPPPEQRPTREQQEDMDAVNKGIEEARSELMWLREQVARERSRLERLRRQSPGAGYNQTQEKPPAPPGHGHRPQQTTPTADSPWVILGLRPGASIDDIRRRYRLLSRVWHPDRFIDGPPELRAEAEVMMARLNRANNALSSQAAGFKR